MARTRSDIKTLVDSYAGSGRATEQATLIESLCDEALKVALLQHPFQDSLSPPGTDIAIVEDATSFSLSTITNLQRVVSVRLLETSGSRDLWMNMRGTYWWDNNVVNAENNQKGWPANGLQRQSTIYLDRPCESGLSARVRASTSQTFASDSTECPISLLDVFVTQYVTAFVFRAVEQIEQFVSWKRDALGPDWDRGTVGGSLLNAINIDKKTWTQELNAERKGRVDVDGFSVLNQITDAPNYGNTEFWAQS